MNKKGFTGLIFIFLMNFLFLSCSKKEVSIQSLLAEMTDRMNVTYFSDPIYSIEQFSSYDRRSTSPDEEGWFANRDFTQFLREEYHEGRREYVLFDTIGPGAVVRFWMTFSGEGASNGILRIYLDDDPEPVISDSVLKVISGGLLAGEPLSSSVSHLTDYQRRGHNLYLPIPYSKRCKISYECDAIDISDLNRKPSVYYNITYRMYDPATIVNSLTKSELKKIKNDIDKANRLLFEADLTHRMLDQGTIHQTIEPTDTIHYHVSGSGMAIGNISLNIKAEHMDQALRSTVLAMCFDGINTVWIPVGEFFGTGYEIHPSKTWYSQVTADGLMNAGWIMPFRENVTLELINFDDQSIEVDLNITFIPYKWEESSMYFGSSWHEYYQIHSADIKERHTDEWHFDVNYIDIDGKGHYVGDALTVFNTADAWWGEGDEKIYVDGESFPSCIGTGTEDYYGYAWCRPEPFSHPFIAQPTGAGNFHPGMTVNMRYRSLDVIPFETNIRSDMELWHWALTKINYAMTSYYYVLPGFKINVQPDIEAVKRPVAHSRSDIYNPRPLSNGILEGEWLKLVRVDGGQTEIQSAAWYDWSENSQLWWHHASVGNQLELEFEVAEAGFYNMSMVLTQAKDYGIIKIYINGKSAGDYFNGYISEGIKTRKHELGKHHLKKGANFVVLEVLGADPKSEEGNMAGIDFLEIIRES